MGQRVHIAVFGVGLGHAARMSLVADTLKEEGIILSFSSFFYVVDYLRKKGFRCERVAPMDIGWRDGGVSTADTFRRIPKLFANFASQVRQESRIINKLQPDLVISDSRLSVVVAAHIAKIPSITVSNQLRILLPPKYQLTSLSKVERIDTELLGIFWSRSELILVPDLPAPYTLSERNICEGWTSKGKVRYVGFMTPPSEICDESIRKVSKVLNLDGSKKIVFAQISGPPKTVAKTFEASISAAEELSNKIIFIISKGVVGGDEAPRKIKGGWFFEWCPFKDELFTIADVIVLRGGHSSLSQAIISGKPVIAIPISNHSEQMMNTSKIADMGVGVQIYPSELTGRSLSSAVKAVISDTSFKEKAFQLGKFAKRMDGVKNTTEIVKSLL